jgi:GTP-binding protein
MLRKELASYNPEMVEKPFLVVLNKIDQEGAPELAAEFREKYPFESSSLFEISALEAINIAPFLEALRTLAQRDSIRY